MTATEMMMVAMMMMAMMMMMTMEDQIVALSMFVITGFFITISYYRIFTTIISMLSFICIIITFFKSNRYYLSVSSQNVSQFSFYQYHHHFILDPEIFLGKEGICFICSLPNVFRSPTPPCLDLLIARIGITFGAAFTILIIVRLISIMMMMMTTMMTTMRKMMMMRKMRITIIRV